MYHVAQERILICLMFSQLQCHETAINLMMHMFTRLTHQRHFFFSIREMFEHSRCRALTLATCSHNSLGKTRDLCCPRQKATSLLDSSSEGLLWIGTRSNQTRKRNSSSTLKVLANNLLHSRLFDHVFKKLLRIQFHCR